MPDLMVARWHSFLFICFKLPTSTTSNLSLRIPTYNFLYERGRDVITASMENKRAWFVGSGLASLAGAAFLVRDAQMFGDKITILEESDLLGGALDGIREPEKGFIIRGGREMEDHWEYLWDLYQSIPSRHLRLRVPAFWMNFTG
ncbi:oleate hydratase [Aspergillus udagawae]|uniref:Oleate hydratase n=1 Tax=Aspergillus udagawae TaxID=91492 RepID=A0A8H3P866_9EURO|nr:oleate hydratase [Aspergillus udagawae]